MAATATATLAINISGNAAGLNASLASVQKGLAGLQTQAAAPISLKLGNQSELLRGAAQLRTEAAADAAREAKRQAYTQPQVQTSLLQGLGQALSGTGRGALQGGQGLLSGLKLFGQGAAAGWQGSGGGGGGGAGAGGLSMLGLSPQVFSSVREAVYGSLAAPFNLASGATKLLAGTVSGLTGGLSAVAGAIPVVGSAVGGLVSVLGGLVTGPLHLFAGLLDSVASAIPAVGRQISELASQVYSFAQGTVAVATRVQELRVSFISVSGGSEQARTAIERLQETTLKLPVSLGTLAQISHQFQALGYSAQQAAREIEVAARLASTGLAPLEQGTRDLAGQMISLGLQAHVGFGEVQALAQKGIPIFEALERQLERTGRTIRGSLRGMLERGEITGGDVVSALRDASQGLGEQLDKRASTLSSTWTRIQAAGERLLARVGEKLIVAFDLKGTEDKLLSFFDQLANKAGLLDGIMARLGGAFKAIRDVAFGALESIVGSLSNISGEVEDLEKVEEQWYNATLDALSGAGVFFLQLSQTATRAIGKVIEVLGYGVDKVAQFAGAISMAWQTMQAAQNLNLTQAKIKEIAKSGIDIATSISGGGMVSFGKGLQETDTTAQQEQLKQFVNAQKEAHKAAKDLASAQEHGIKAGEGWEAVGKMMERVVTPAERLVALSRELSTMAAPFSGKGLTAMQNMQYQVMELDRALAKQNENLAKGGKDIVISQRDILAVKAAQYESLTSSLNPFIQQQTKTAGPLQRFSREAYSAEVQFRMAGRLDPTERLIRAQDAALAQQKIQAQLLEAILARLGQAAVIPLKPGVRPGVGAAAGGGG